MFDYYTLRAFLSRGYGIMDGAGFGNFFATYYGTGYGHGFGAHYRGPPPKRGDGDPPVELVKLPEGTRRKTGRARPTPMEVKVETA